MRTVLASMVCLMALVAFIAPAQAQTTTTTTTAPGAAAEEVQRLLDRRVAALLAGDADAFMATVDINASEGFKNRQRQYYAGWRSVPIGRLSLQVRLDDSGDLSGGARKYGNRQVFLPETRQVYRLGEYDGTDAIDSLYLTYVKRATGWKVTADDDLAAIGLVSGVNLWTIAPVTVLATDHFLIIGDIRAADRVTRLASVSETAFTRFSARWKRPWHGRVPLLVPGDSQQAQRLLGPSVNLDNFVAFVVYTPIRTPEYSVTAPRMYAGTAGLNRTASQQADDFVHELTHVATAADTGPFTPVWVHEGLAEFIRLGSPSPSALTAPTDAKLPSNPAFSAQSPGELRRAYDTSLRAVAELVEAKGPNSPYAVLQASDARSNAPGSPAFNADLALRAATGLSTAELEQLLVP